MLQLVCCSELQCRVAACCRESVLASARDELIMQVCCTVLRFGAAWCSVVQRGAVCVALCCGLVQRGAAWCSVCCSVLQEIRLSD